MKKKHNKGFSLVELIVTITIMAVLVGVTAPIFTRYIEKARRQTCYTNVDTINRAVQMMAYSDADTMEAFLNAATSVEGDTSKGDITSYVQSHTDIVLPKCPSKGTYTIIIDKNTNEISMHCSMVIHELPTEGGDENGETE